MRNFNEENEYKCLINDEEQYSLWPLWKQIPLGWREVGITGSKEDCLNYIKEKWVDIRPKSLRS